MKETIEQKTKEYAEKSKLLGRSNMKGKEYAYLAGAAEMQRRMEAVQSLLEENLDKSRIREDFLVRIIETTLKKIEDVCCICEKSPRDTDLYRIYKKLNPILFNIKISDLEP